MGWLLFRSLFIFVSMRPTAALVLVSAFFTSCGGGASSDAEARDSAVVVLAVEGVEGSSIRLADGRLVTTGLHELNYIGQVRGTAKAPWLVMSGRYCDECDALLALYVHSPGGGPMRIEHGEGALQYPGRLLDGETGEVYYSTRTFFGEVLDGVQGVISYENVIDAGAEGEWYTNLTDLSAATRRDTQYMDTSRLPQTLDLAAKGKCQEIPGMDQMSAP